MGDRLRCAYCGYGPAKRRLPGAPPTCHQHADLPRCEPHLLVEQLERRLVTELDDEREQEHRGVGCDP